MVHWSRASHEWNWNSCPLGLGVIEHWTGQLLTTQNSKHLWKLVQLAHSAILMSLTGGVHSFWLLFFSSNCYASISKDSKCQESVLALYSKGTGISAGPVFLVQFVLWSMVCFVKILLKLDPWTLILNYFKNILRI